MTRFSIKTSLCILAGVAALSAACGSENDEELTGEPDPKLPNGGPDPIVGEAPFCAESTGTYGATREPSNVLFLYDRSGSMHIKLPSQETRWEATKKGFFDLLAVLPPTTTAGLMVFPQGDAPVNDHCRIDPSINDVKCNAGWPEPGQATRCDPATYTLGVVNDLLSPAQVTAMQDHVMSSDAGFYWGTPLSTALNAAIASQKASDRPGAKSVILLTDGNPTSCDKAGISNDVEHVVAAARKGLDGTLVRTFVIGLTDSATQAAKAENLSPIAVAGGTARAPGCEADNSCFYALTDMNFAADLKRVFEEVSVQAFDCTFNLPEASAGTDPDKINVELAAANGGTRTVKRDTSHADGWDYLPNGTQIQLYGQACTDMKDPAANLRIVLGCKTVATDPPAPVPLPK